MSTKTEMLYVNYQDVYRFLFTKLTSIFDDWPIVIPPNLIILKRGNNNPNPNDPRGQITLGEMVMGYVPALTSKQTAFPYWSVIRLYQTGISKAIQLHFDSELTWLGGLWFVLSDIMHELMHYIMAMVKYLRIGEHNNMIEMRGFASDLYEHHILHALGTMTDEYRTERLTIQALTAIALGREHLSIYDLLSESLLLPKPDGQFFCSFTDSFYDKKDESFIYQAALGIRYRYATMNIAFGDPARHDQYVDEYNDAVRKIKASAKPYHEKYGKTWKLSDMTKAERSKWLT